MICSVCEKEIDVMNDRNISRTRQHGPRGKVWVYTCGDCVAGYASRQRANELPSLMRRAGVPRRFANVSPVELSPTGPLMSYIFGGVGTGKTYLACRFIARWLLGGKPAAFLNSTRVALALQSCFQDGGGESIKTELAKIADSKSLLVIDDFGTERQSPFVKQSWYAIIDARWGNLLPTIITSNLDLSRVAANMDGEEKKIADRLRDFKQIKLSGRTLRGKGGRDDKEEKAGEL